MAVAVLVAGVVYLLVPHTDDVIRSEPEARASCQVALASHLRDFKKSDEKWQIVEVRFESSTDKWFCVLTGDRNKKLYIILKPKTGGFEVSSSDS